MKLICLFVLIWSFAQAIYEQIPAAVPSLAVGCVLQYSKHGDHEEMPQWSRFLFTEVPDYEARHGQGTLLRHVHVHDVCSVTALCCGFDAEESTGSTVMRLQPNNDTLQTLTCVRASYLLLSVEATATSVSCCVMS